MTKCWNAEYKYNYYTDLALGKIPQRTQYAKFGTNPDITANVESTVWDYPDLDKYIFQDGPQEHFISSSDNTDNQLFLIQGLDSLYRFKTIVINLQGQTKTSIGIWSRTFRALNNNSIDLSGNVYIYEDTTVVGGVPTDPTKVRAYVDLNEQQTRMLVYTVPANYTALLIDITSSIAKKQSAAVKFRLKRRDFGKVMRSVTSWGMVTGGPPLVYNGTIKGPYTEKTDIEITAETSEIDVETSGFFTLELIRNE